MTDKEKRIKKYMDNLRYRKRLERKAKNWRGYPKAAVFVEEKHVGNGKYETVEKPYVQKLYCSSNCDRYSYNKRRSNRMVRRHKGAIPNGNGYRRVFDYAWEVD